MAIRKLKPTRTPRLFDAWSVKQAINAKERVKKSENAVMRSQELVAQSKDIIARLRERREKKIS